MSILKAIILIVFHGLTDKFNEPAHLEMKTKLKI